MIFRIYEVLILHTLSSLEGYEELLNNQNLTLNPIKEIEKLRERLKTSIGDYKRLFDEETFNEIERLHRRSEHTF